MCLKRKEWHDLKHSICKEKLAIGSIVLLHDTRRKKDMSRKLSFKWLGLYQIYNAIKGKGIYILEEFDGSQLASIFIGDRLKKFHLRQQLQLDHAPNLDHEEISTLNNFVIGNNDSDFSDVLDNLSAIWQISSFSWFTPMHLSSWVKCTNIVIFSSAVFRFFLVFIF